MCILSVMYVSFWVSGYKHITFDGLLLEEKSNFMCCYIYITDCGYPSQIVIQSCIRMKEHILRSNLRLESLIC